MKKEEHSQNKQQNLSKASSIYKVKDENIKKMNEYLKKHNK